MRIERDSMGPVEVPEARLYGAQTQRSLEHFAIGQERMPRGLIRALVQVKRAAAVVNESLGVLSADKSRAIVRAADEVLGGAHPEDFPLSVWQTGSGTQTNMNVNEVLANRASELLGGPRGPGRLVHPNDDVNRSQSSNDAFPTAMHLFALDALRGGVLPALSELRRAFADKSEAYPSLVKVGRTHLMDAVPLTVGQELSAFVAQLEHAQACIEATIPALQQIALGGTAVGTGLNAPPGFADSVARELASLTGEPIVSAPNKFFAQATHDPLVAAHGALKVLAVTLTKIANDIRLLASGPRSGIGELLLPENEPGSSIMPGKVNPTQAEALAMVACQVIGNDVTVSVAGSQGHFQLQAYKPLLVHVFGQSAQLLTDGMRSFERHAVRGLEPDTRRIAELLERSLMLVTALTPHIGYDAAAAIAKKAHAEGTTLREAALALEAASEADLDRWLDPSAMIRPHGLRG
ncbi:MAG: class II fumarate hydratase [Myxococcales bacterium]|nr:class II fumarate hydratase [Myxococcales bacterium]